MDDEAYGDVGLEAICDMVGLAQLQRYNTYLLLPPTALSGAPRERVKARSSYVMRPHYQLHASISYMANVSIMRAASRTTKVFSGAGRSGPVLLPQSWPSWACW